jgi:hypothetical protein
MANTQSKEEKEGKEKKKSIDVKTNLTTIHMPPRKEEDVETTIQIMWRKFDFNHVFSNLFFSAQNKKCSYD